MKEMKTRTISCRIPSDRAAELDLLSRRTDRPRSWHVRQAVYSYLDLQAWQVGQIEQSIAEMDAGLGISHEEIRDELAKWGSQDTADRTR